MLINYTISEKDFVAAGRLFLKTRRDRTFYRRVIAPALWIVLGVSTLVFIWSSKAWSAILPLALVFSLVPASRLLLPWQLRRNFRKTPILHDSRSLEIQDSGLHFTSSVSDSKTTWELYFRFAENEATFILVQQGNQIFFPIPKREITPVQIAEVRSLFETHIPRR